MTFDGYCLIKNDISVPKKVINLYISYTLTPWLRNLNTEFKAKHYEIKDYALCLGNISKDFTINNKKKGG